MRKRNYHPYIDSYMDDIRSGKTPASEEITKAMDYIEEKLDDDDIFIDSEKIFKAVELCEKYFDVKMFPWEKFCFALIHCYYKDDTLVFTTFIFVMGRGNGKNGFISMVTWYLSTHYHGIKGYNVDIIANNEEQAKTSFDDVYEVLESHEKKMKKFFSWTKEKIKNIKTLSYIKYNTANAKTKDGKRSGCEIFDEIHEYRDYEMINVFQSAFGKVKHSRTFYITTNGYVREGVLDDKLELSRKILSGEITDLRTLPLIYKIDKKEEYKNPKMWEKACPSLPYLKTLQIEMQDEFKRMKYEPHVAMDFFTKRMNFPCEDSHLVVAPWEQVKNTNRPIPYEKIAGAACIGAVDYAQINDFCSVGLLFKLPEEYVFLEHTFVCHKALEIESRRIEFPVREFAEKGLITIVNTDVIEGKVIAEWFIKQAEKYNILDIVADDFRKSVLKTAFDEKGLPLSSVRSGPVTHSRVSPLIDTMFAENKIIFGDNPTMRWYISNTYKEIDGKGNITYKKVEPKKRKTDGFFCLLHAVSVEDKIPIQNSGKFFDLDVIEC